MSKESKTARASAVKAPKEVQKDFTPEESIKIIRANLEAKLHIPIHHIAALLGQYDAAVAEKALLADKLAGEKDVNSVAIHDLMATVKRQEKELAALGVIADPNPGISFASGYGS